MPRGRPRKNPIEGEVKESLQEKVTELVEAATGEPAGKKSGIYEFRKIGTHGVAFVCFSTGDQFWVEYGKSSNRREVIDVFKPHLEQYPWKLGGMDNNRRIPVWVYDPKDENGKEVSLQYLHYKTNKLYNVKDLHRVKDEKKSAENGREFFDWYIETEKGEKVQVRVGEGMFGRLEVNCLFTNVQEVSSDAVSGYWPGRRPHLDISGTGFEKLGVSPALAETSNRPEPSGDPEGVKTAGVKSGKLEKPLIGTIPG